MHTLFDSQRESIVTDYTGRLAEMEQIKNQEFSDMKNELEKKIEELIEQLRLEREKLQGSAQELRQKMQDEIDDLKR
jgi:predicted transcriptional regulator